MVTATIGFVRNFLHVLLLTFHISSFENIYYYYLLFFPKSFDSFSYNYDKHLYKIVVLGVEKAASHVALVCKKGTGAWRYHCKRDSILSQNYSNEKAWLTQLVQVDE